MKDYEFFPFMLRPGAKLILIYMVFAYLVPGILIGLTGVPNYYIDAPVNLAASGMLLSAFLVYLALSNLRALPSVTHREQYDFRFIGTTSQIVILALLALAAAYGFATDMSGFRYSDISLSERGSLAVFVFSLVPTLLQFFLLVYVFYDREFSLRRGAGQLIKKTLLIIGLFLSANGIATMLLATLATVYIFFPNTFGRFLLRSEGDSRRTFTMRLHHRAKLIILFCALGCAAASAWVLGESTKRGELESVLELVTGEGILYWFLEWTVSRSSPSYISLAIALDQFALSQSWQVLSEHLMAPVESFLFRVNYLLMDLFDVVRPDDGSIMRINYNLITANPVNLREGTAPGLIAGFLYCFPFPLNFLVLIGYLIFIQRFLSRLVSALPARPTLAGQCVFLIFMLSLFASPIDLLLIIDGGTIAFMLLILLRQGFIQRKRIELSSSRPDIATSAVSR